MNYLNAKLTTMRDGKIYEFVPNENITAYELANIMLYLYACNSVGVKYTETEGLEDFFDKFFKEI